MIRTGFIFFTLLFYIFLNNSPILAVNYNSCQTPLFKACLNKNFKKAERLIARGADINKRNPACYMTGWYFQEETPIFAAVYNEDFKMVKYLIKKGANLNISTSNYGTPLHKLISKYNLGSEYSNIPYPDKFRVNTNINKGSLQLIKYLILNGANLNAIHIKKGAYKKTGTPLHMIMDHIRYFNNKYHPKEMNSARYENMIRTIKFMVKHGADINIPRPANGCTPLWMAADKGDLNLVKFFITSGAIVDKQNIGGLTPLSKALWNKDVKMAKYLKDHGASYNSESVRSWKSYNKEKFLYGIWDKFFWFSPSIIYMGSSIYFNEIKYKNNPEDNRLRPVNGFLSPVTFGIIGGGILGYIFTSEGRGIAGGLRKVAGGAVGSLIGGVIGIALSTTHYYENTFRNNRFHYYSTPGFIMAITLISYEF